MYTINEVHSITELAADSATSKRYMVNVNVTNSATSETYDAPYVTDGSDVAELNLLILQWIVDHPEFPIDPYVVPEPPTIEEIREAMPTLTRRQLRLGLINNGIYPSQAQTIIDAMPSGVAKEKFSVEWNDGDQFRRLHSSIVTMLAALLLTSEDIDTLWMDSVSI